MSPTSSVPYDSAFLWTPHDEAPFRFDSRGRWESLGSWPFDGKLKEMVKEQRAFGVMFRVRRRVKAPWIAPGSAVPDNSEKDAVVIGLIHKDVQAPIFWASASMGLVKREDGSDTDLPVLSDWIEVSASSVPNNLADVQMVP